MKPLLIMWLVGFQLVVCSASKISKAGTWRDDFEDRITKEWTIFNLDRRVERWWVNEGEAVGQIFQPGFSTKTKGWGLGLNLSKRIIEKIHNGSIELLTSNNKIGTLGLDPCSMYSINKIISNILTISSSLKSPTK